ncbi:response regulator [Cohnella caldifontis]|uniref:response regulator n=1 Tax=Cohnella caldifontis TaxID=3027471 RepID=UPI0023EBD52C|nr:response regulator [Cohnella sp. YIM B05605]
MKVALVDDEERIRFGLAKLIAQAGCDCEVTGVYAGGQELLSDIDRLDADLLITDMKMPNMSGLELIGKLRTLRPHLRFAVLSGFDDFHFAREALRLGALDYLLKPVDTGELAALLEKAKRRLEEEVRDNRPIRPEDGLRLLSFGDAETVPAPLREEASRWLEETGTFRDHYAVFVAHGGGAGGSRDVLAAAEAWHREWLAELRDDGRAVFAVAIREGDHADTVSELGQTLLRRLPPGFRGRIGASDVYRGAIRLREAYAEALEAVRHAWYGDGAAAFECHARLPRRSETALPAHPVVLLDRDFREAVSLSDTDRALAILRDWLADAFRGQPAWAELKSACETVLAFAGGSPAEQAAAADPERFPDRESFMSAYLRAVEESFRRQRGDKPENRVIETVKAYIQRHYAEELELSRLAETVYLTPSYLSKLFKTETGETITDYLISVRIEHAKALLRGRNGLKTYEVGERIGYADPAYFNKIFKKVAGCTPKEFRDRVRR